MSKELINYQDYIHIFNSKTNTYDLIHKKTGTVLKQDVSFAVNKAKTEFDPATGDLICHKIMEGQTLTQVCREEGMPSLTVVGLWRKNNPAFAEAIRFAREMAAELFHDRVHDIANEAAAGVHKDEVPSLKLATDNFKWLAEKANPERFAKQKEVGDTNTAITINLRTGVHESRIASDIEVDEFGNFKGFNNGNSESRGSGEPLETRSIEDIELGTERYKIVGEESDEET